MKAVAVQLRPASTSLDDQAHRFDLYCSLLRSYVEAAFGWDLGFQREGFDRKCSPKDTSVVLVNDEPVGFVVAVPGAESVHVHMLLIRPEWQGLGVGRMVMGLVGDQAAAKVLPVTLSCFRANVRAVEFYSRLGFKVSQEDEHFVSLILATAATELAGQ